MGCPCGPHRPGNQSGPPNHLFRSIQEVISYLESVDPDAAARARERYACFDHVGEDPQAYGYRAAFGAGDSCEREAIEQLVELQLHAVEYARRDGLLAEDELFYAEQNARTVKAAEEYYRTMFGGRVSSWNLRDQHMVDTLDSLAVHLSRPRGRQARIVVWAHNSHLGDARTTEMASRGELSACVPHVQRIEADLPVACDQLDAIRAST